MLEMYRPLQNTQHTIILPFPRGDRFYSLELTLYEYWDGGSDSIEDKLKRYVYEHVKPMFSFSYIMGIFRYGDFGQMVHMYSVGEMVGEKMYHSLVDLFYGIVNRLVLIEEFEDFSEEEYNSLYTFAHLGLFPYTGINSDGGTAYLIPVFH